MSRTPILIILLRLCFAIPWVAVSQSHGEEGMCLIVATSMPDVYAGDIHRIDVRDGSVTKTWETVGVGRFPRFSPDGSQFVCVHGCTVRIYGVEGGSVKKTFPVDEIEPKVSWGTAGIYVGLSGKIALYDTDGNKQWEKSFPNCGKSFVSRDGTRGASVIKATGSDGKNTYRVCVHTIATRTTLVFGDEQGCSGSCSPDGSKITQNRGDDWETCHLYMRIRNADGTIKNSFYIGDLTGLKEAEGWCWNTQSFSGNSNDWILLPIGQTSVNRGCRQPNKNTQPWIYNIATKRAYCLANRTTDFWFPQDYYSGMIYQPAIP